MQHHIDFTVQLLCWNTNTKVLLRNANPGLQNHYMYKMPSSLRSGNGLIHFIWLSSRIYCVVWIKNTLCYKFKEFERLIEANTNFHRDFSSAELVHTVTYIHTYIFINLATTIVILVFQDAYRAFSLHFRWFCYHMYISACTSGVLYLYIIEKYSCVLCII